MLLLLLEILGKLLRVRHVDFSASFAAIIVIGAVIIIVVFLGSGRLLSGSRSCAARLGFLLARVVIVAFREYII